jgi:hypothetical protein
VVDFRAILPILADARADLNLSIENPTAMMPVQAIPIFDPRWSAAHPDLSVEEFAAFVELVAACEQRVASGELIDLETYQRLPFGYAEAVGYIADSAAYLRGLIDELGLPS